MKKIILFLSAMLAFSCSDDKSEENSNKEFTFIFGARAQLCPDSNEDAIGCKIMLFPGDKEYVVKTFPSTGILDPGIDKDIENTFETGYIKTKDGESIKCLYSGNNSGTGGNYDKYYESIQVKTGRYFVLIKAVGSLSTIQHWSYTNKYSAKYIDVNSDTGVSKCFYGDVEHGGFQEWDMTNWKCN